MVKANFLFCPRLLKMKCITIRSLQTSPHKSCIIILFAKVVSCICHYFVCTVVVSRLQLTCSTGGKYVKKRNWRPFFPFSRRLAVAELEDIIADTIVTKCSPAHNTSASRSLQVRFHIENSTDDANATLSTSFPYFRWQFLGNCQTFFFSLQERQILPFQNTFPYFGILQNMDVNWTFAFWLL